MKDHHIHLLWSDEDDCYVADLPDFEYCSASGDTPQEALAEVLIAKRGWIETARELGIPIPEPRYRPAPLGPPKRQSVDAQHRRALYSPS